MSTKTIELIDPHEHAGRDYPPGTELVLDTDSADWLIALKKAKAVITEFRAGITPAIPASSGKPETSTAHSIKENAA